MEKKVYICMGILVIVLLCIGVAFLIPKKQQFQNNALIEKQSIKQEIDNNDIKQEEIDLKKISIKVEEDSLSKTGVTIIITDNNEVNFPWSDGYKIQINRGEKWMDVNPKNELITSALSNWKDENNQYKQKINWEFYYGELENGRYRIAKPIYIKEKDNYIDLYSSEFEIN